MEKQVYKVLIADDEYWTRKKISGMIDWHRYSLECMEPAADGEEVLERLKQEQPDILITDINMPFVSGVELLKIVHETYPDIITFVISGYDDFMYVRETFMAGSINYLIKPITKVDLVQALSKALEIISSRQADAREREDQKAELLKAASLLQDREFSQFLEREESPFTPVITINNDIQFAGVSLMLIKIHDLSSLAASYGYDMNLLSYSVKREIKADFESEDLFIFHHIYKPNEFAIVSELDNRVLITKARHLMAQLKQRVNSPLTIMISGHSYSMESIHEAYIKNIAMLMSRKYTPEDVLLISEPERHSEEKKNICSRFGDGQAAELKKLLQLKNRNATLQLVLTATGLEECVAREWSFLEVKQTVKRILNCLSEALTESLMPDELAVLENMIAQSDRVIEKLDAVNMCETIRDIIEYCLAIGPADDTTDSVSDIIRKAAEYIDEHYYEELSLSTLSRRFGVEKSYFSRLFGQQLGENLMLYITRTRMAKAAGFMQGSDISLTEIAFMVGYDDYTYFSRVFRKVYGSSPRTYREQLLQTGGLT